MSAAKPDAGVLILLAAGSGSRFGSDKRQHLMSTGNSLLATTLALYQDYYDQIVVVLRPGDEHLGQEILRSQKNTRALQVVYAERANQGMGHSLASGARKVLENTGSAAMPTTLTVALADMPYVQPSTLQHLQATCARLSTPYIVQPRYQGKPGNPVAFSGDFLQAFTQLQGDQGARAIVREQTEVVQLVTVDDPGIHQDIDQPQDIQP